MTSPELCPDDAVCIDVPGAVGIATWAGQLERMHEALKGCKYIQFELPVVPVTDQLEAWADKRR